MALEIAISTINERIEQACCILDQHLSDVHYRVCHQVTNGLDYDQVYTRYPNVEFLVMEEKGLSKSRNKLLETSEADHIYFCDDDLTLRPDMPGNLEDILSSYPDTDICCFRLEDPDGGQLKNYAGARFRLGRKHAGSVSSAEVIYNRKALQDSDLLFNERFGLGAEFISGEENLLIDQAIQHGLQVWFFPMTIATHPADRTGIRFTAEMIRSKGAIHAARFGNKAGMMHLLFTLRKFPMYRSRMRAATFLRYLYSGSKSYRQHG